MNVGQRVMIIAIWDDFCSPPPIGSIGSIITALDEYGDYEVSIPDWPCPNHFDPDWFVPKWALIPIDDGEHVRADEDMLTI